MASAETTACSQAADLFADGERDSLLQVGTLREVAEEAVRRLLRAGRLPWWPLDRTGGGAWAVLAQMDVVLLRAPISEAGRYYDGPRAIVLREGLPEREEAAVLWHEVIHAERRHRACDLTPAEHADVEREAQRRAVHCG